MRITTGLSPLADVALRELAGELHARHATTPFANTLGVSEWIVATLNNPRLSVKTDPDGRVITVSRQLNKRDRHDRPLSEVLLTVRCSGTGAY